MIAELQAATRLLNCWLCSAAQHHNSCESRAFMQCRLSSFYRYSGGGTSPTKEDTHSTHPAGN